MIFAREDEHDNVNNVDGKGNKEYLATKAHCDGSDGDSQWCGEGQGQGSRHFQSDHILLQLMTLQTCWDFLLRVPRYAWLEICVRL